MWSDYSTEPNKANVEWTPYVDESGDFRPEKYLIYKGRAMNSMKLVDSVPGTSTVYIDEHNDGATYYRVTFSKKNQCVVTGKLKSDGGPYSQSLSNLAESKLLDSRYLDELSLVLDLSPVPARDVAVVVVKNKKNVVFDLSIIDMVGNETLVAKQIKQDTYSQAIDVSTYSPGQYVIQLKAKNQVLTHKLVITR
jgi:hypothetical protein